MAKPILKPKSPYFSSGPCKKFPGWRFDLLSNALLGRSHRHRDGYAKLKPAIDRAHRLLQMPEDYKLALLPGSCTGAVEAAFWNLLGSRGVDVLSCDIFGKRWIEDVVRHLHIEDVRIFDEPFGKLPDLSQVDSNRDVVFTWNATTAGVMIPHHDWIKEDRQGLTICDATSAAFSCELPWPKLDAVAFSWQKVMGGEAAHGMLALSPRALKQLETYQPPWPIPFLLKLTETLDNPTTHGKIKEGIFRGETLNTPSLMCVEDWLVTLQWAEDLGGLPALIEKTNANAQVIWDWVETCPYLENLAEDPATRSKTSICLKLTDPKLKDLDKPERWSVIKQVCKLLETEQAAYDIKGHGLADPCFRIWCGPTVEKEDLQALTTWIDWAYQEVAKELEKTQTPELLEKLKHLWSRIVEFFKQLGGRTD